MTAPPKRRWFRFGLRTLFIVVTIFAVWLGWQRSIVQERKALIAELDQMDMGFRYETVESIEVRTGRFGALEYTRIPVVRKWLGDEAVFEMHLPRHLYDEDLVFRTEHAFPEAKIVSLYGLDFRDSIYAPPSERRPNRGTLFKTGLIEHSQP